jgi:hypothetical protein
MASPSSTLLKLIARCVFELANRQGSTTLDVGVFRLSISSGNRGHSPARATTRTEMSS